MLRCGVDVAALLASVQIPLEQLAAPEAMLRWEQVEQLVAAVAQIGGHTDLALDVGRSLKLSSHSMVGFGMLSSPNADYALRLASRFFKLIMPAFRMRYRARAGQAEIAFEPAVPMSRLSLQFHLEVVAAATHCELRELLQGRLPDYDLYLSIPEPPHAARYAEFPEMRCHFGWPGAPGLLMRLAGDFAEHPLALADPASLKMAEARCDAMVQRAVARGKVSDWIDMMLRESGDGWPTMVELAHTLNRSPRTLERYLAREGMRFDEIARRARHAKACALLDAGELSITQIAYELGYTDAANFTRAFRRDAGMPPSRYRLQRGQQTDAD